MKLSTIIKAAQSYDDDWDDDQDEDSDVQTTPHGSLRNIGPTLGTLEHAILTDMRISDFEKRFAVQKLQQETGYASPSTPLSSVIGRLGGGVLGAMVARMMGLGGVGMGIAGIAGYGVGKIVSDFYLNQSPAKNKYMIR